jgi:cysteinyl-tRNA synthetase
MALTVLGSSVDVLAGGADLTYPHHVYQQAMAVAASRVADRPTSYARRLMHVGEVRLDGEKMAKSTGNIARVGELVEAGVPPRAIRYALLSVHYRAPLNFSDESLAAAAAAIERIDALLAALAAYREDRDDDPSLLAALDAIRAGFEAGLDDDLNVSAALGALFDGIRDLNRRIDARTLSTADAGRAAALIRDLDRVLGVAAPADAALDAELQVLLDARAAARANRDWAESDRLRDELLVRGVAVEDTRDGQRWRPLVTSGG